MKRIPLLRSELSVDLKLKVPLMAGVYGEISIQLDLSVPGHISETGMKPIRSYV